MRYLAPLRSRAEDDAAFERQRAAFEDHGTCGWAIERISDGTLIGICGIMPARPGMPIEGSMEFGWRFERQHRGQGYEFEAARAALDHPFVADDSPLKRHILYRIDRPTHV